RKASGANSAGRRNGGAASACNPRASTPATKAATQAPVTTPTAAGATSCQKTPAPPDGSPTDFGSSFMNSCQPGGASPPKGSGGTGCRQFPGFNDISLVP